MTTQLPTAVPDFKILPVAGLESQVLCVCFERRLDLTQSFFRLQEFYESPFAEIKGRYFTLEEWDKWYTHNGVYLKVLDGEDYFSYWEGFNIPRDAAINFKFKWERSGTPFSPFEQWLFEQLAANYEVKYIIAVDLTSDPTTLQHEICHAWFALHKPFYIEAFDRMLAVFRRLGLRRSQQLLQGLLDAGYPNELTILCDELAAYLLTSSLQELEETFPGIYEYELESFQEEYRRNFDRIVDIEWGGAGE